MPAHLLTYPARTMQEKLDFQWVKLLDVCDGRLFHCIWQGIPTISNIWNTSAQRWVHSQPPWHQWHHITSVLLPVVFEGHSKDLLAKSGISYTWSESLKPLQLAQKWEKQKESGDILKYQNESIFKRCRKQQKCRLSLLLSFGCCSPSAFADNEQNCDVMQ